MNRRILGIVALGVAMVATTPSAFGFGKRKNDCGTTGYGYGAGYGAGYGCGSPCDTGTVTYVDQKVMVTEWKAVKEEYKYTVNEPVTKKEKVKVKEQQWKDEAYKYTVYEPKTTKEKVKVKEQQWKDEAYKYWVNETKTVKEKVKVADVKAVTKEVDVTTYTLTPVTTMQTRTVCEWVCVPVQVTCAVGPTASAPARRGLFGGGLCGKKKDCGAVNSCADPCGAPCPQYVTRTVMQRQMVTRTVQVPCTTYTQVPRTEKRPVTTYETIWVEKEVDVVKCIPVEKTGTHKVAFWVDVEKETDVTRMVAVEKTGTHKVAFWADVEKETDVTTWRQVEKVGTRDVMKPFQVEKVVKVPVYTPAPPMAPPVAAPCPTPCAPAYYAPCGTSGGYNTSRGGLFRGCCGK